MLLSIACVFFAALQERVAGQKLNGPLTAPNARVYNAYLSGDFAVYHALQDGPAIGLYTSELRTGFANQPLVLHPAGVTGFAAPPVEEQVLFIAGNALQTIAVDGSSAAVPIQAGALLFLQNLRVVPGGSQIVYSAADGGPPWNFYRAPIDGRGPPLALAGPYASPALAEVSADGATIVFAARASLNAGYEILAVSVRGGSVASLSRGPLPARGSPPRLGVSPDGSRAVYLADVVEPGRYELFGVPTDGTEAPARLHPRLRAGESIGLYRDSDPSAVYSHDPPFVISAEGSVVFVALLRRRLTRFHLFQVPLGVGLRPRRLATWPWPNELAFDDGYSLGNLAVDPSGRWIVFQVITVSDIPSGRGRLFSVSAKGDRPPVELSSGVVGAFDGLPAPFSDSPSFKITADGSRVVFLLHDGPSLAQSLLSVPIDGSAQAARLVALPSQRRVQRYEAHGQSVLYLANPGSGAQMELFSAPLLGGQTPVRLNLALPSGGRVTTFHARAGEVLYLADQDTRGVQELYYSTFP